MSGKINFESRAFHVCPHAQQAPSIFTASLLSVFWQPTTHQPLAHGPVQDSQQPLYEREDPV